MSSKTLLGDRKQRIEIVKGYSKSKRRSDPGPKLLPPLTSEVTKDAYTFDGTESEESVSMRERKSTGSLSLKPNNKRKRPLPSNSQKPKLNLTYKKSENILNEETEDSQKSKVLYKKRSKEVENEDVFATTADENDSTSDGSQRQHEQNLGFKIPIGMKFKPLCSAINDIEGSLPTDSE